MHHRVRRKKEAVATHKLFTKFLNEAASDEDDLPNTDNESTNTTVDEDINLVNTTGQPSVSYIILKVTFIILVTVVL